MRHYIFNTRTGKTLQVTQHSDFYRDVMADVKNLSKIGITDKNAQNKVSDFIKNEGKYTDDVEVFCMNNFPLVKASVYSDNKNVSFSYFRGASLNDVMDIVFDFCSNNYFTYVRIYNYAKGKDFEGTWEELKEDDGGARMRLASISERLVLVAKTLFAFDSEAYSELKKNDDAIWNEIDKLAFSNPSQRLLKNFKAYVDVDNGRKYVYDVTGKLVIPYAEILKTMLKYSKKFGTLSRQDQMKTLDKFLSSYNTLPLEDVFLQVFGETEKEKAGEIQAEYKKTGQGLEIIFKWSQINELL